MKSSNTKLVDRLRSKSYKFVNYCRKMIENDFDNYNVLNYKFNWKKEDLIKWKNKYRHWKNKDYHIDHIIPLHAFIENKFIKNEDDITLKNLLIINDINNLQLLSSYDNNSKSYKYVQEHYEKYMENY